MSEPKEQKGEEVISQDISGQRVRGARNSLSQEKLREATSNMQFPDYGRRFYMELVLTMCSHLPDEDWEKVKRLRTSRRREGEST